MKSPYKLIETEKLEILRADYQKILQSNLAATTFIKEIENGNLEAVFSTEVNEEEALTQALLAMQEQLQKIAVEEKERNWSTQGLALFAEILRSDNDNSKVFYQQIISNLVKYLDANQGGLFLIDDEDEANIGIELVSCYAYNKQKFLNKRINPGEGLIGQCYLEKDTIFMTDIPQNYVQITSGLGTANPACLLIVPLKINEQVHGFVEIASFKSLQPFQVEFLERLGESIASSISTVKINHRTKRLLEDTQQQAEEMRAQEEEMRQNMEELSATQEEMGRIGAEMEGQLAAINKTMATIEFDLKGNILAANDNFLKLLEYSLHEIEGKHHRIFLENSERQSSEYLEFWKQLAEGKGLSGEFKRISKSGKEIYIRGIYNPIFDLEGSPKKILKIAYDITAAKEMELQVRNQLDEAHAQEEEMRQNLEELSATQEEMKKIMKEVELNERHTRELIGASTDTIFVLDKAYNIIDFNTAFSAAYQRLGVNIEKGVNIIEVLGKGEGDKHKELYERAFKGEKFEVTEHIPGPDLYFLSNYSPLHTAEGEVYAIAVFARDITEMVKITNETEKLLRETQQQTEEIKAQEEELRQNMEELSATQEEMEKVMLETQEQEQHFGELLNGSSESIFAIDPHYKVISWNKAFEATFGRNGKGVNKGMDILEVFPPEERAAKVNIFKRVLAGEAVEISNPFENGEMKCEINARHIPLRNKSEKIIAVGIFLKIGQVSAQTSKMQKTEKGKQKQ